MAAALCILATLGSLWVLAALPVEAKTAAWIAGDRCDMRLPESVYGLLPPLRAAR